MLQVIQTTRRVLYFYTCLKRNRSLYPDIWGVVHHHFSIVGMRYYTEGKTEGNLLTSIHCLRQRKSLSSEVLLRHEKTPQKMCGRDSRKLWFRSSDATVVTQVSPWTRWWSNFPPIRELESLPGYTGIAVASRSSFMPTLCWFHSHTIDNGRSSLLFGMRFCAAFTAATLAALAALLAEATALFTLSSTLGTSYALSVALLASCTALRTFEWFTAIGDPGIKFWVLKVSRTPFCQWPACVSPFLNVYMPKPCLLPSCHAPSYLCPLAKL